MSAFSLFKRQASHRSLEKLHETVCSTEGNKYGSNNSALVLSVSVQSSSYLMMSAAENRWNFQYSQYPGPLFHSTAQPPYSAFWASLFLPFMAFNSNSAIIHISRNACTHAVFALFEVSEKKAGPSLLC